MKNSEQKKIVVIQKKDNKRKGNYILGETIGQGAFAKVKIGIHIYTGEKVAIKILNKKKICKDEDIDSTESNNLAKIRKEINILKRLRHKNIIHLYEIMETNSNIYIVMEYCEGKELFNYIVKKRQLAETEACRIFQQIINGVEYLHLSGVTHRDLKPENLLMDKQKQIYITDFGLSYINLDNNNLLSTPCGTPSYAPPEMLRGDKYNGVYSDIWSCGIILYTMLVGTLPCSESKEEVIYDTIMKHNYDYPEYLSEEAVDLLENMLKVDPKERFSFEQIKMHQWFNLVKPQLKPGIIQGIHKIPVDKNILKNVSKFGYSAAECSKSVSNNKYDSLSAIYYLILKQFKNSGKSSISDLNSEKYLKFLKDKNNWLNKEVIHEPEFRDYDVDWEPSNRKMKDTDDSNNKKGDKEIRSETPKSEKNYTKEIEINEFNIDDNSNDDENNNNNYNNSNNDKNVKNKNINRTDYKTTHNDNLIKTNNKNSEDKYNHSSQKINKRTNNFIEAQKAIANSNNKTCYSSVTKQKIKSKPKSILEIYKSERKNSLLNSVNSDRYNQEIKNNNYVNNQTIGNNSVNLKIINKFSFYKTIHNQKQSVKRKKNYNHKLINQSFTRNFNAFFNQHLSNPIINETSYAREESVPKNRRESISKKKANKNSSNKSVINTSINSITINNNNATANNNIMISINNTSVANKTFFDSSKGLKPYENPGILNDNSENTNIYTKISNVANKGNPKKNKKEDISDNEILTMQLQAEKKTKLLSDLEYRESKFDEFLKLLDKMHDDNNTIDELDYLENENYDNTLEDKENKTNNNANNTNGNNVNNTNGNNVIYTNGNNVNNTNSNNVIYTSSNNANNDTKNIVNLIANKLIKTTIFNKFLFNKRKNKPNIKSNLENKFYIIQKYKNLYEAMKGGRNGNIFRKNLREFNYYTFNEFLNDEEDKVFGDELMNNEYLGKFLSKIKQSVKMNEPKIKKNKSKKMINKVMRICNYTIRDNPNKNYYSTLLNAYKKKRY